MRDAHITQRKDNPSNSSVMGTVRVIDSFTDQHGENRQIETFVEVRIFTPAVANEIAAKAPKAGDQIEVWGKMLHETREYTDPKSGEVKTAQNYRITVSDENTEHTASLLA